MSQVGDKKRRVGSNFPTKRSHEAADSPDKPELKDGMVSASLVSRLRKASHSLLCHLFILPSRI